MTLPTISTLCSQFHCKAPHFLHSPCLSSLSVQSVISLPQHAHAINLVP
jgi:hypothetical protein